MSEEFKLEIVNPEKSFLSKEDVTEVLVPAYEGDMGILKDHISIISFLKPGILKVFSKSGEDKYYVEDLFLRNLENIFMDNEDNLPYFLDLVSEAYRQVSLNQIFSLNHLQVK